MQEYQKKISFIPGPSALYPTVNNHFRDAIRFGVTEQSHRSPYFKSLYSNTLSSLKVLLSIPDNFYIVFTSSATEIWEHSLNNLVERTSFHLINGAFGKRFYDFAVKKKIDAKAIFSSKDNASVIIPDKKSIADNPELIAITLNESSNGIYFPTDDIKRVRQQFPESIIGVDTVSDTPFTQLDYNDIDFFYFSVQKCFGLPSGLGVWVLNDKCLEKAKALEKSNKVIGTYRNVPEMVKKSQEHQTIETPNILNIYLLGKVAEDMLNKGIENIRLEIEQKEKIISDFVTTTNNKLSFFVKNKKQKSKTVIVLETKKPNKICGFMYNNGFLVANGYGKYKNSHIRIGNFAASPVESVEKIVNLFGSII